MVKVGRCIGCGAHRILRTSCVCKRCTKIGIEIEEEEENIE